MPVAHWESWWTAFLGVRPGSLRRIPRLALNPLLFTICNIDFHQDDGLDLVTGKPPGTIHHIGDVHFPPKLVESPEVYQGQPSVAP